jgi:hypothetical protein
MDYSQFKVLEFRRKFFKFFGASITIFDGASNSKVGLIIMQAFRLRSDISVYTDDAKTQEIVHIGGKQIISFKPLYEILDRNMGQKLGSIRFQGLKSYLFRVHLDVLDSADSRLGYVQETSSQLAIMRRWLGLLPLGDYLELIFAFVPQTFNIMYAPEGATPLLVGKITHRKNPVIVKMSLNTTEAQHSWDARINIALCTILSILDANKNA